MSLSAFLDVARGGFFDNWHFITILLMARSRVDRHGALKAPWGFHDTGGLFLFKV